MYYSSASKSSRDFVQSVYPEGIARTSFNKGAFVPRAFFRPVRTANEPASRAGWVRLIRIKRRVSGLVEVVLAGVCRCFRVGAGCAWGVEAAILVYEGSGLGIWGLKAREGAMDIGWCPGEGVVMGVVRGAEPPL